MDTFVTSLKFLAIPALKDNYIWAIIDPKQNQAAIIDPGDALVVHQFLEQHSLTLTAILITHHHWDHTNGVMELKNRYDVPVFGSSNENIPGLTMPVQENDEIQLPPLPLTFQVMAIPGHTLGHIAYYAPHILFCGDTLFAAGCGRLFEGTAEQLYSSLQKLMALPDDTNVYCAHEYTLNNLLFAEKVEPGNANIAKRILRVKEMRANNAPSLPSLMKEEKETNPFLRCHSAELIANVETYAGCELRDSIDVFRWLRKWKDHF